MDHDAANKLEVASRRGLSAALHPDACPKLRFHGVEYAVPPRTGQVQPVFGPEGVTIEASEADDWPEAAELLTLIDVKAQETCEACGQPVRSDLVIDTRGRAVLVACSLAAKLLDRQYTLTNEQLGALMAFPFGAVPDWLMDLLAWSAGNG